MQWKSDKLKYVASTENNSEENFFGDFRRFRNATAFREIRENNNKKMVETETSSGMHSEPRACANGTDELYSNDKFKELLMAMQKFAGNDTTLVLAESRKNPGIKIFSYTISGGIHEAKGEVASKKVIFGNYVVPENMEYATIRFLDPESGKGSIYTYLFKRNGSLEYKSRIKHIVLGSASKLPR